VSSSQVEVVLYGAPDCHLCDDARAVLVPAAAGLGFTLRTVDVSTSPELERRYRRQIPVVEIDGARAFVFHVAPSELERAVRDAQARREQASS
jgi:hypothetical protein